MKRRYKVVEILPSPDGDVEQPPSLIYDTLEGAERILAALEKENINFDVYKIKETEETGKNKKEGMNG